MEYDLIHQRCISNIFLVRSIEMYYYNKNTLVSYDGMNNLISLNAKIKLCNCFIYLKKEDSSIFSKI